MAKRSYTSVRGLGDEEADFPAKKAKIEPTHNASPLLDLPGELRNAIFDYALTDLWNKPPLCHPLFHSNFTTYYALQLVNKQIAHESGGVFDAAYAPNLTIFTTSIPHLYDILKASHHSRQSLQLSRFRVCNNGRCGRDEEHNEAIPCYLPIYCFIAMQHGWARRDKELFVGYDIEDIIQRQGTPALEHYFEKYPNRRAPTPIDISRMNEKRKTYRFHKFGNGITVKSFEIGVRKSWTRARRWLSYVVLKGRLADLAMDTEDNIECMRVHTSCGKQCSFGMLCNNASPVWRAFDIWTQVRACSHRRLGMQG